MGFCSVLSAQDLPFFKVPSGSINRLPRKFDNLDKRMNELIEVLKSDTLDCKGGSVLSNNREKERREQENNSLSFSDEKEFLMGETSVAEWAEKIRNVEERVNSGFYKIEVLEEHQYCEVHADLRTSINKGILEYDYLNQLYEIELKKARVAISNYVKKNHQLAPIQARQIELKNIERSQGVLGVSAFGLQSKETILDQIAEANGVSKKEAYDFMVKKVSEAIPQVQAGQNHAFIEGMKIEAKSKSFSQRLQPRFNISFNRTHPSTLDIFGGFGYKISPKLVSGFQLNQRFSLGDGWEDIKVGTLGWGARVFTDYNFWKGFFTQASYEGFNGAFQASPGTNEIREQKWNTVLLLGLGSQQPLTQSLNINTILLYRVRHDLNTQFPNRWIVRVGFTMNKK